MANSAATLALVMKLRDEATPGFGRLASTLGRNRASFAQLAMGVSFLGSSFLGLGIALSQTNNQLLKNIGQTAMLAGGFLSAVGSSLQFIRAIAQMISALNKLRTAQILAQAFAGPAGWAALGIGAAVAVGTVAGVSRLKSGQMKVSRSSSTVNNYNFGGSLVTERQVNNATRRYVIKKGDQNGNSGVR